MKTHQDAEGREYYLKEGEIHYVDEDKPDPSVPRRRRLIAIGAGLIAVILGFGITQFGGRTASTAPSAADQDLFRTQVALEQTQTALAVTSVKVVVPTQAPVVAVTFTPPIIGGTEALTIAFAKIDPTCTQRYFAGTVNLDVAGTGQAGGGDWSDAFYLYQHPDGTAYNPPQTQQFDLEIDGDRAIKTLRLVDNPPDFNADHRYQVPYNVGEIPRPICFRISDYNVGDNSGEFAITVSST